MVGEKDALVLFCKPPERSKQRLVSLLGRQRATELAEKLLACALEDLAAWPGSTVISPAEAADRGWAEGLGSAANRIVPQRGGNLGERLSDIDLQLRNEGYATRLYIGIDCPLLDAPTLTAAAEALDEAGIVLGAAEDGGVVFMGTGPGWPRLSDLPWSTERLAKTLAGACEAAGQTVRWLGRWPDVDRATDLGALAAALMDDRRPARQRLREWLQRQEYGQRQEEM